MQLESRRVYTGRVVRVDVDTVRFPDGSTGELEIIRHPGAAAIVPCASDPQGDPDPTILLIRQFRYAAGGPLWEIPAGTLDPGEDPAACARRELLEEAGGTAGRLQRLASIWAPPGLTDQGVHLYLAGGLPAGGSSRARGAGVEGVVQRALERQALHELDDGRLVLEHLSGDHQAFGTLVDRYQTRLLNFINRTIGDRERAEDLVQEVFIRVFRHLHRFDQTKKFSTWIYTIASNLAKNELRNRSRNPLVLFQTIKKHWEADHRPLQFEDTTARPDDLYRKRYLKEAVDQCVGQLPPTTAPSSCCASSRGRATPRSPTSPVATWAR